MKTQLKTPEVQTGQGNSGDSFAPPRGLLGAVHEVFPKTHDRQPLDRWKKLERECVGTS